MTALEFALVIVFIAAGVGACLAYVRHREAKLVKAVSTIIADEAARLTHAHNLLAFDYWEFKKRVEAKPSSNVTPLRPGPRGPVQ